MADVGVLNLQIQENSESAIRGLDNLADALGRVRDAVAGVKLSPVAASLKRIATVVNDTIQDSTIVRIGKLADELSKLKGVGNVTIKISGGDSARAVRDVVKETRDALGGINTGFDDFGSRAYRARDDLEGFNNTVRNTADLIQNRAWTAGVEEFRKLFEEMSRLRMMFSLPAGAETGMSTQVEQGWTSWKNGAIEVEGTVTDAMENVVARLGEPIPLLTDTASRLGSMNSYLGRTNDLMEDFARNTSAMSSGEYAIIPYTVANVAADAAEIVRDAVSTTTAETQETVEKALSAEEEYAKEFEAICEQMKEKAAEAQAISKKQEEQFYSSGMSMEKTNQMADNLTKLDLLQAQLQEAEKKYNEFVNNLGAKNLKSVKAGMDVQSLRDQIWEYKEALRDANAENTETVGVTETVRNQFDTVASSISTATGAAHEHADVIKKTAESAKNAGEKVKSAGAGFDGLKKTLKNMFPLLDKLKKRLETQIITRSIRYMLRSITSGIKEGIENVYKYSQAIGGGFAPAMDSAASSLLTMKNSLGAAAAPLLQSMIPVMQTLVNWFIEGVNWLNQFISLLRGQTTWTRAVPATTTAFDKQEKAAKKAGKSIKDLLADWDELNIIQSQTSGSGSGIGTSNAEEAINMFEEVSTFSKGVRDVVGYIQDHMDDIKRIAGEVGMAILGWKISKAFSGVLGKLTSVLELGVLIKLSNDITKQLNNAYIETGDAFALIADGIISTAAAALGGKLMNVATGGKAGIGKITAGLMLSISAGTTFSMAKTAKEAEDEAKSKVLSILGGVKWGIGSALTTMGFLAKGVKLGPALAGGVILSTLVTAVTFAVEVHAAEQQKASDFAKSAFAATGTGGINAQEYADELKAEFKKRTEPVQLILDAYVTVPDLKNKLEAATADITTFNEKIFSGEGELTDEEAEAFKKNWGIVLDTLDRMGRTTYDTLLQGAASALHSANEELRKEAEETRINLIMASENVSEARAKWIKETNDLKDRIASGNYTNEDLEKYKNRLSALNQGKRNEYVDSVGAEIVRSNAIDFGDEKTALDNAKSFLDTVGKAAEDAFVKVEQAKMAMQESAAMAKAELDSLLKDGAITPEEYTGSMAAIQASVDVTTEFLTETEEEIRKKQQEAYDRVFSQVMEAADMTGVNKGSYWENVIRPLINQAKKTGYTVPKEVLEKFTDEYMANYKANLVDDMVKSTPLAPLMNFFDSIVGRISSKFTGGAELTTSEVAARFYDLITGGSNETSAEQHVDYDAEAEKFERLKDATFEVVQASVTKAFKGGIQSWLINGLLGMYAPNQSTSDAAQGSAIQRGFSVLDPEILEMAREDAKANIPVSWSDSEVFNYLSDYWGSEGIAIFDEVIRNLKELDEQLYGTWSGLETKGPGAAMEDVLTASYAGIMQGLSGIGIPGLSGNLFRVDQAGAANGMYATGGYAGATDDADMEKAMRNGSKEANAELETQGNLTNQLLQGLLRAIRNGITVNMAAGSGAGFTVQKAIDSTAAINGYTV